MGRETYEAATCRTGWEGTPQGGESWGPLTGVHVCRDETVITRQERSGLAPKVTRINGLPDLDLVVV